MYLLSLVDLAISLYSIFFRTQDRGVTDFSSYYAQGEAFLDGERDYNKLNGPNGPPYYPAGHVYFYAFISWSGLAYNLLYS